MFNSTLNNISDTCFSWNNRMHKSNTKRFNKIPLE